MLMIHKWRNIKRTDEKNEIIRQAQKLDIENKKQEPN